MGVRIAPASRSHHSEDQKVQEGKAFTWRWRQGREEEAECQPAEGKLLGHFGIEAHCTQRIVARVAARPEALPQGRMRARWASIVLSHLV